MVIGAFPSGAGFPLQVLAGVWDFSPVCAQSLAQGCFVLTSAVNRSVSAFQVIVNGLT